MVYWRISLLISVATACLVAWHVWVSMDGLWNGSIIRLSMALDGFKGYGHIDESHARRVCSYLYR
jgi:hypothetical protein